MDNALAMVGIASAAICPAAHHAMFTAGAAGPHLGTQTSPVPLMLVVYRSHPERRRLMSVVSIAEFPENGFSRAAQGSAVRALTDAGVRHLLAPTAPTSQASIPVDLAVIADLDQPYHQPWPQVADIIVGDHRTHRQPSLPWITGSLARYPAAAAAVTRQSDGAVVGLRDGHLVTVDRLTHPVDGGVLAGIETLLAASLCSLPPDASIDAASQAAVYMVADPSTGDHVPAAATGNPEPAGCWLRCPIRLRVGRWDLAE
jgi:hypothetical protein